MFSKLINAIKSDKENQERFQNIFNEKEIAAKTVLLREGETAHNIFFIKKGCLREWFNKDGKDITFQFFLKDNQLPQSIVL